MRHPLTGLLGNTLDVDTKTWVRRDSGIGAGLDSFYEYLLKVGRLCHVASMHLCRTYAMDDNFCRKSSAVRVSVP